MKALQLEHLDELGDLIGLAGIFGVGAQDGLPGVIQSGAAGTPRHLPHL